MSSAVQFDEPTRRALEDHDVAYRRVRGRNILFDAVPVGPAFTKTRTNLLLNGRDDKGPWQIFVDEDLQYTGPDVVRWRMLCGPVEKRWRRLELSSSCHGSVAAAFRYVLRWLESPLCESIASATPTTPAQATMSAVLGGFGRLLRHDELVPEHMIAWSEQSEAAAQTAETVLRTDGPRCGVVVGPTGCGKTTTARMAAAGLVQRGLVAHVLELDGARICSGAIFGPERDERLRQVLAAAVDHPSLLILFERFDLPLGHSQVGTALLTSTIDRGVKLVLVSPPNFDLDDLMRDAALCRRLQPIQLAQPKRDEMCQILNAQIRHHPACHNRVVASEVVQVIVGSQPQLDQANPAVAISILEAALSRAAWTGSTHVGPDDVLFALQQHVSNFNS